MNFPRLLLSLFIWETFCLTSCSSGSDGGSESSVDFRVSPSSLSYSAAGDTKTLAVVSGSTPTVSTSASWLNVTEASRSEKLSSTSYSVTADANVTTEAREATISVSAGSNSATVKVTQSAGTFSVSVSELSFAAAGGTQTFTVSGYGTIEVSSSQFWLTATAGALDGSVTTVTVSADENSDEAARTATITVKAGTNSASVNVKQAAAAGVLTATAADIAPLMYPGWNLGNTMEGGNNANNWKNVGISTETSWQSTKTTREVIDFVKSRGFKSVRIPTAWVMGHVTSESEVTVDAAWMARVKEIVDYCVSDGLYVLLNDHWDGGWLENSFGDISDATVTLNAGKLKKLWTQIAEAFSEYDEHLLFGGLNEPDCDSQAKTNALLKYEQAFIDAVRATGGNNAKRTLVVQGPQTNISNTNKWLDLSKISDPAGTGYLMVEVHYYDPPQFTGVWENNQPVWFWGSENHVSGDSHNATWGEEDYVKSQFQLMKTKFADKGYPVILGEYGVNWRNLSSNQDKQDASVKLYHKTVCREAVNCGMIPMVWDINSPNQNGTTGIMTVINRATLSVFNPHALEGIQEGIAAAEWPR